MIVDKDTGKVYDIRNEGHLNRLSKRTTTTIRMSSNVQGAPTFGGPRADTEKVVNRQSTWGDFWKIKKQRNQDFLIAAEGGDLEEMTRMLDPSQPLENIPDINAKGLDAWSALHVAANEGLPEIVKDLLARKAEVDSLSSL